MTGVRELATSQPELWRRAVRHPFLDAVRDGTMPDSAFDRWLEQDRHFIEHLTRAWARVLVTAPRADLGLLAEGAASFCDELVWLEASFERRDLDAEQPELPATTTYGSWLHEVSAMPYPVALAAFWAVEAAYSEAWRSARPGAASYRHYVEHWASDTFASFVDRIEHTADAALAAQPEHQDAATAAILTTAEHEAQFWAMTWDR